MRRHLWWAFALTALCSVVLGQSPQEGPRFYATAEYEVPGQPDGPWGHGLDGQGAGDSYYSLRDDNYVTSVKNQGGCGACWAFATYSSFESSVLMSGGPSGVDLSENHLKNYHGFDLGPCDGGNVSMAAAYMSRLDGPVSEADDPYNAYDDRPSPGGPRQYFLSDLSYYRNATDIKNAVIDRGALYTSMYMNTGYYRSSDQTYYYSGSTGTNHAVAIVGWDDDKVTAAPAAGAWQAKNSYGSGWGDGGYFWIAYEDTKACKYGASFQAADVHTVESVYFHDDFGRVSSLNTPYGLNVFQADQNEYLNSIGFYTQVSESNYDLRIYDTFTDGEPSGLLAQQTGVVPWDGYHVIDLDQLLPLTAGDDFAVYLHITNGGTAPMAMDLADSGYSSGSTASAGESYYSFAGTSWTDLTSYNSTANFSIKAYTQSTPEPGTFVLFACYAGIVGVFIRVRKRRAMRRGK